MGHFQVACAVSRFGISGGQKVRLIMVTERQYSDERFPTAMMNFTAIRGEYDGYGRVVNLQDGMAKRAMEQMISDLVIDRGPGDNTIHQLAATKGKKLEEMLEVTNQRRVRLRDTRDFSFLANWSSFLRNPGQQAELLDAVSKRWEPDAPEYDGKVPTIERVTELLAGLGYKVNNSDNSLSPLVDDETGLYTRIRMPRTSWSSGVATPQVVLEYIQGRMQEAGFATMLSVGSGSYAFNSSMELILRAKPNTPNFHGHCPSPDQNAKVIQLGYILVRDDVWQELMTTRITDLDCYNTDSKFQSADDFVKGAAEVWHSCLNNLVKEADGDTALFNLFGSEGKRSQFAEELVGSDGSYCGIASLPLHFKRVLLESAAQIRSGKELNPEDVQEFLTDVGQALLFTNIARNCGIVLSPQPSIIPQDPLSRAHVTLSGKMYKVALEEMKKQYGGDEFEDFVLPLKTVPGDQVLVEVDLTAAQVESVIKEIKSLADKGFKFMKPDKKTTKKPIPKKRPHGRKGKK